MYAAAVERFGGIDVLFNNAGISPPDDDSILETELDAWRRVPEGNLTSVYLCCKYGIPHLLERGGGAGGNTPSVVAVPGGAPRHISSTPSQGGGAAARRELGGPFAPQGGRGNAPCPGPA